MLVVLCNITFNHNIDCLIFMIKYKVQIFEFMETVKLLIMPHLLLHVLTTETRNEKFVKQRDIEKMKKGFD